VEDSFSAALSTWPVKAALQNIQLLCQIQQEAEDWDSSETEVCVLDHACWIITKRTKRVKR